MQGWVLGDIVLAGTIIACIVAALIVFCVALLNDRLEDYEYDDDADQFVRKRGWLWKRLWHQAKSRQDSDPNSSSPDDS